MPRGGKRPGAGLPKGFKYPSTLAKEKMRVRYWARVGPQIDALADAQVALAKGVEHMMAQDSKTGQWIQVTDPAIMLKCLEAGATFYRISAQNPNGLALTDIFNRLMDKPTEHHEVTGEDGGPLEVQIAQRLVGARKRK